MSNRKKQAIDKIAEKVKSLLEETDHQVEIKRSDAEPGYCLVFNLEKSVNGRTLMRNFTLTDTSPYPTRHQRFQMFFKYCPEMKAHEIFEKVKIDGYIMWPTDWIRHPKLFPRAKSQPENDA